VSPEHVEHTWHQSVRTAPALSWPAGQAQDRGDEFLPFEQRMAREPGPAQLRGKAAANAVKAWFGPGRGHAADPAAAGSAPGIALAHAGGASGRAGGDGGCGGARGAAGSNPGGVAGGGRGSDEEAAALLARLPDRPGVPALTRAYSVAY